MTYLKITEEGVLWPYSLWDLRRDNPNVSFPTVLTSEDLEPFSVYAVRYQDRPDYDERTQKLVEITPQLINDEWTQAWGLRDATPEEINEYDISCRPSPNWSGFKEALMGDEETNTTMARALSVAPIAILALPASLISASVGSGSEDFISIWTSLRSQNIITTSFVDKVVELAKNYNLPIDFITLLKVEL